MKKRLSVLLLAAAVVSAAATMAAQSTPPASTTLRMRGTIDTYDASTRMLSLSTSNGTVQFPLASVARIRRGGQTIDASELKKLSGYHAVVRYSESGGHKAVESVHVFGKNERTGR